MEKDSGINWHCDNCKALLNSQSGFNSHANLWKCKACGHQNCISENKVVQIRKIYKCLVCRYTLSDQSKTIDKGVSKDLIGEDYKNVIEKLKETGFTDIETEKIVDLSIEDVNQNNKVLDVKI